MTDKQWLESRVLRSVDNLRLWAENPRLDPEEAHISIADFATDLIQDSGEKEYFLGLINSIAKGGFISMEPIVVWKHESNQKYYVAEGNRRVLALKLLRSPEKAPKSIRRFVRERSTYIDRNSIEKIRVCVAPTFDDCEWYINQRHSTASLQRRWSRLQQQRWVTGLYDKYEGNIEKVIDLTGQSKSELISTIRIIKLRDLALDPLVLAKLSASEIESVKSHRLPMTIIERWFKPELLEAWGIEFEGENVHIISNYKSFMRAYAEWIKLVINRDEKDVPIRINTRTITEKFDEILSRLPEVSFEKEPEDEDPAEPPEPEEDDPAKDKDDDPKPPSKPDNRNPDRSQLIVGIYHLQTSNYKLSALFGDLKKLPIKRYKHCTGAIMRVFLDLSILEYIETEDLATALCTRYKSKLQDIPLKLRLEYLKSNKLTARTPAYKVVEKLLNSSNEFSLDTLNNYVHGKSSVHVDQRFLNRFWDFLFPLFEEILEIKES